MALDDVRAALDALIRDTGEDYASLSRLIGRNAAYIQQFIKRGTPRRLAERDRRLLARYFAVPETMLGGPEELPQRLRLVSVAALDVGASAGAGALPGAETARASFAFDPLWLRRRGLNQAALSVIRVEGDSMQPTLSDGDDIMVDRGDAADRLRPGIYVLRMDGVLMVKRVTPLGRAQAAVTSDNPVHPSWPEADLSNFDIIGRVVWVGRRLD